MALDPTFIGGMPSFTPSFTGGAAGPSYADGRNTQGGSSVNFSSPFMVGGAAIDRGSIGGILNSAWPYVVAALAIVLVLRRK